MNLALFFLLVHDLFNEAVAFQDLAADFKNLGLSIQNLESRISDLEEEVNKLKNKNEHLESILGSSEIQDRFRIITKGSDLLISTQRFAPLQC